MSGHGHDHHHHAHGARLGWVAALNVVITIAQLVGGIMAGSLALLSDALHNASDVLALLVAWWAARLKRRPADSHYTFGLRRAEILAALFNAATLVGIAVYLAIEATGRLADPPPVSAGIVIMLAALGLLVNGASVWFLSAGAEQDMNQRAAWLHLMGDALTSLAVLIGGLAMMWWGVYWVDPLITILISAYLVLASWRIVREAVDVLLMAVPAHLSLQEIEAALEELPEVEDVHHLHLWQLDGDQMHFEAHVRVRDMTLGDAAPLRNAIRGILDQRFGISHVTLQMESEYCETAPAAEPSCRPPAHPDAQ